jgi:GNAT superfamily N-acetyltransferase
MLRLVRAEDGLHDRILDETHPLWNDGLSREEYGRYNRAQLNTEWGRHHLSRMALVSGDDDLLSTAKRYDLQLSVDGRTVRTVGIGAVFTPQRHRGRGHARRLIEAIVGEAKADGAALALLFSEIGAAYYQRLGFRAVPLREVDIAVTRRPGAPAMLVRSGDDRDLAHIAAIHEEMSAAYRFALAYDRSWLQYAISKKRVHAALSPQGRRIVEWFVAEEGGQAVAWVLLQVTGRDRPGRAEAWSVAACGDRDPSGARVGALLQALAARNPSVPVPPIRAWGPGRWTPPQLTLGERRPATIIMMAQPLGPEARPVADLGPDDVLYWHGDAF